MEKFLNFERMQFISNYEIFWPGCVIYEFPDRLVHTFVIASRGHSSLKIIGSISGMKLLEELKRTMKGSLSN